MTFQTKGIVVKRTDIRETDRLYIIYTDDRGKIQVLAKGAKKIKSKMAGHLEPLSVVSLTVAPGKNLNHLAGAFLERSFPLILSDLKKNVVAGYILEIIDQLTEVDKPDRKIFDLLEKFLINLNGKSDFKPSFFIAAFTAQLLALLGYAPELHHCLNCRKIILPRKNYFNLGRGGLVCDACHNKGAKPASPAGKFEFPVSVSAIKILRLFLQKKLTFRSKIKITDATAKEVYRIVHGFLNFHLNQPLKSAVFLEKILEKDRKSRLPSR